MAGSQAQRLLLATLAFASFLGCGGTATDARGVAEVARPRAPGGDAAPSAPVDTAQPRDLAMLMRLRSPEDTVDAASFVSGTPLSILLEVVSHIESAKVIGAVDLQAPVDAAVVVPPDAALAERAEGDAEDGAPEATPLAAIAFGVISTERFVAAFPGAATTRPRRDGTVQLATEDVVCSVPGAAGKARVVCGSSADAVRRLGPWMTVTLAREPPPAPDAHLTFLAAPARDAIRKMVARDLRDEAVGAREELQQLGIGDPELLAIPDVLLDEVEALAEDADRLELALDLDAAARTASAKATVRFRGSSSWTTRVLSDPAERRGPPPAIFWRAPRDADAASWALSSSPRHFAAIRRVMSKAVSLGMSRAGATPDETAAVVGAIDGIPSYGGAWATAQGALPWKTPARGGATPQNAVADLKDRSRAFLGWGVAVVETPSGAWSKWVGDVHTAYRKVLAGARRSFAGDDILADAPEVRVVKGPAGYPAGSVALDVIVKIDSELAWSSSPRVVDGPDGMRPPHPPGAVARSTMTLRFVVAPDGDRTVLGWSLDDAALRARVRSMLRDAPVTGTITGRPDLKRLERPGTGGGYFTLRPWVDLALGVASQESSSDSELALVTRAVASMPNRGATPILTFADGTAGPTPSLVLEVLVQEGTIEDLRALGQFAMGQGMREALEGLGGTEAGSTMGGPIGVQPPVVTPSPAPTAPSPGTRPPAR